jgi:two-component system, OmpR family, sensor kinase
MKIWLRIFILATAVALVSIALTGVLAVRAGYQAQIDAEVRGLLHMADAVAGFATNAIRTADYLSASPPTAIEYIQQMSGLVAGGITLEIYPVDSHVPVYAAGLNTLPPLDAEAPELEAAAHGRTTWILRRMEGDLILTVALPETITGEIFIFRASTRLVSLDVYSASQALMLGFSGLAAAILLSGASLVGSRAIARSLEALSLRAAAIAAGDYSGRVDVRGRNEVARLGSELNRMADAVAGSIRRLEQEKASRQAFIDDLTHELRTPVTSIVGFADHLRRHAWDEALFTEGLTRIHDEGLRILATSEGLKRLLLTRTRSRAPIEEEVADVLQRAAADARRRHGSHAFAVEAVPGIRLAMDRDLMLAALGNLLDNAARAAPPGSTIDLAWEQDVAVRRIVVRDPGGAAAPGEPGLGLGKAICREIADYHGARLEYEPRPGGGTVASIVFANLP